MDVSTAVITLLSLRPGTLYKPVINVPQHFHVAVAFAMLLLIHHYPPHRASGGVAIAVGKVLLCRGGTSTIAIVRIAAAGLV